MSAESKPPPPNPWLACERCGAPHSHHVSLWSVLAVHVCVMCQRDWDEYSITSNLWREIKNARLRMSAAVERGDDTFTSLLTAIDDLELKAVDAIRQFLESPP